MEELKEVASYEIIQISWKQKSKGEKMPDQMAGSKRVWVHFEYVFLTKNVFFDDLFTNFRRNFTLLSKFFAKKRIKQSREIIFTITFKYR